MAVHPVDYEAMAPRVVDALRKQFPVDTIKVSEGHAGRVHAKVVSESLEGMSEQEKQQLVWGVLDRELGPDAQAVGIVLAYGTDEL